MEKIKGLIDAPFTPMHPNGDINLEVIPAYADMLVKNGLKGVFINGSSGEGYMLTPEERMAVAEKWVASVPKDFKVIVHVGSCCLRESVTLAAHAEKNWSMGYRLNGSSLPEDRSYRGAREILRGDCGCRSNASVLLLPYSGI